MKMPPLLFNRAFFIELTLMTLYYRLQTAPGRSRRAAFLERKNRACGAKKNVPYAQTPYVRKVGVREI